jgi:hypothetical protein
MKYFLPVIRPSRGFSVILFSLTERNQIAKSQSGYKRDFSISCFVSNLQKYFDRVVE